MGEGRVAWCVRARAVRKVGIGRGRLFRKSHVDCLFRVWTAEAGKAKKHTVFYMCAKRAAVDRCKLRCVSCKIVFRL